MLVVLCFLCPAKFKESMSFCMLQCLPASHQENKGQPFEPSSEDDIYAAFELMLGMLQRGPGESRRFKCRNRWVKSSGPAVS